LTRVCLPLPISQNQKAILFFGNNHPPTSKYYSNNWRWEDGYYLLLTGPIIG
jgi:hypothetical protein